MKIMSRNFTRTEKILLLVLAIVLLGLVYYIFVYRNVSDSIASSNAEKNSLQTEYDGALARLSQLKGMKEEVVDVKKSGSLSRMESYNNSKNETAFLSDILSDTRDYNISFSDVTRNGDQIRRSFSLHYRTGNYREAEAIMLRLCQSRYRCLIGDVNCNIAADGETSMDMTATFFETMVGGVPDAGLPEDQEATKTQ